MALADQHGNKVGFTRSNIPSLYTRQHLDLSHAPGVFENRVFGPRPNRHLDLLHMRIREASGLHAALHVVVHVNWVAGVLRAFKDHATPFIMI